MKSVDEMREIIGTRMSGLPFEKTGGTVCGPGSTLKNTQSLRDFLPGLFKRYGKVVNDAGCGDFFWMRDLADDIDYRGYDIVRYPTWDHRFTVMDVTEGVMRPCDIILCRDVLIHLPFELIQTALERFRRSGPVLVAPSYRGADNFAATVDKVNNRIDLSAPPFNLDLLESIPDDMNGEARCMGVWTL
jgi:hypothetical protein